MAWSGGRLKILKMLYASNWSTRAIAVAIDMTEGAVLSKIARLTAADDADICLAEILRKILRRRGLAPLSTQQALDALRQPGVIAGLSKIARNDEDEDEPVLPLRGALPVDDRGSAP